MYGDHEQQGWLYQLATTKHILARICGVFELVVEGLGQITMGTGKCG